MQLALGTISQSVELTAAKTPEHKKVIKNSINANLPKAPLFILILMKLVL